MGLVGNAAIHGANRRALLFDIEVAFTYPWAVSARSLGWNGFFLILIFFACLALVRRTQ